ncbi:hypothetical protein [Corynebacterium efficiens YS-314]|uniref:Uncharacterized protein n=1 Tax=Corynebacterium efficiens (strain DSM 44549 / YS-314 / AJ 12310 / JCM 11189 / NBRC 100395) TaxID=196164 RepID=Q8FQW5_COREF|nr:hypothetical protein [Corynebacterium efficiens YS-314]
MSNAAANREKPRAAFLSVGALTTDIFLRGVESGSGPVVGIVTLVERFEMILIRGSLFGFETALGGGTEERRPLQSAQ